MSKPRRGVIAAFGVIEALMSGFVLTSISLVRASTRGREESLR